MSEGCTFVASPFKPSHCKLCFQAKVDHKIPTLKEHKPVTTPTTTTTSTPTSPVQADTKPAAKTYKYQTNPQPVVKQEEPVVENKPVKTYKYQTNPQPIVKQEEPVVENKPVKTYKYQTNPSPLSNSSPPMSASVGITESIVEEKTEGGDNGEEKPAPKKVFKPVGGVMMQGFDPRMLASEAIKRRAKKNLDEGALEEASGTQVVKPVEPTWEQPPENPVRQGPGLGMIGGSALTAALQKRKQKEAAAEALSNPDGVASVIEEEVVEEVSILPPRMKEVMKQIEEEAPVQTSPETVPSQPVSDYVEPIQEANHQQEPNNTTDNAQNNDDENADEWS